ncbi:MAG TPA: tetratricopeptide repeat protein [Candidatus Brocadiaceae bacterium]
MMERDWENAAAYFEKATLLDRSSERIIRHLATCYFQLGQNEKAIEFIEKLVEIKPLEFGVHYTLATLYETTGKTKEAIAEYECARRCKTSKLDHVFLADTLYRLANLYMNEGMTEKGSECYQNMFDLKLVSEPAKIYYEIGQRYFEKNDIKKALEYFLKVREADPTMVSVRFYLSLCYDALNDYENAIKEAVSFLEKEPGNWIVHLALSDIYGKINNEAKKKEELGKSQEILEGNINAGSKNPKEYFLLCQIYRNQQRTDEAIAVVESMKLIPLDREAKRDCHFLLANLYYEYREFSRVEDELIMALKIDPDFDEANNFLGYVYVENNKRLDDAIQLINKALKAQPKNGAYLDSLGWAYFRKASTDEKDDYLSMGLQKLLEAVHILEEPDVYDHVGDVQYSLGHWNEAIQAWEKALEMFKKIPKSEMQCESIRIKLEKIKGLISREKEVLEGIANNQEVQQSVQP